MVVGVLNSSSTNTKEIKNTKKTAGIGDNGGVQQFLLFQSQIPFGSESETWAGQLTLKQWSHHFTLNSNNDKRIPKLSEYFPVFKWYQKLQSFCWRCFVFNSANNKDIKMQLQINAKANPMMLTLSAEK